MLAQCWARPRANWVTAIPETTVDFENPFCSIPGNCYYKNRWTFCWLQLNNAVLSPPSPSSLLISCFFFNFQPRLSICASSLVSDVSFSVWRRHQRTTQLSLTRKDSKVKRPCAYISLIIFPRQEFVLPHSHCSCPSCPLYSNTLNYRPYTDWIKEMNVPLLNILKFQKMMQEMKRLASTKQRFKEATADFKFWNSRGILHQFCT